MSLTLRQAAKYRTFAFLISCSPPQTYLPDQITITNHALHDRGIIIRYRTSDRHHAGVIASFREGNQIDLTFLRTQPLPSVNLAIPTRNADGTWTAHIPHNLKSHMKFDVFIAGHRLGMWTHA